MEGGRGARTGEKEEPRLKIIRGSREVGRNKGPSGPQRFQKEIKKRTGRRKGKKAEKNKG